MRMTTTASFVRSLWGAMPSDRELRVQPLSDHAVIGIVVNANFIPPYSRIKNERFTSGGMIDYTLPVPLNKQPERTYAAPKEQGIYKGFLI
jgi:hypothetical protein